ncbi:beta-ketoacyl-ACP synthase [Facilibium subflavum]|uniref:beta-ketoacyl-ACP synthase n=1 Tax=Facilibium subflavum TaxID=2219058 RepID=UPI000E65E1C0|nr:beta-ketoacyl-ACP synthase [Facilibium subflavum]
MTKRVVITGGGLVTALGDDWVSVFDAFKQQKTATSVIPQWAEIEGLRTNLGAPIKDFQTPSHYTRKQLRSMGRVAQLATVACDKALDDALLKDQKAMIEGGDMGIAYGSCSGSTSALYDLIKIRTHKTLSNVSATTYIKSMSHTCAVNAALFFGLTGRVIPTSSACTSSAQAIGYAYETIKHGYQKLMIAGGAEELCPSQVSIFDTLFATSQQNEHPETTPRPFDRDRDGLVLGEGACSLILEEYAHAKARGAKIYGEIVGFGTNCDARHITQPTSEKMAQALRLALGDAQLDPMAIDYINAHGTATEQGDIAESHATLQVMGDKTPISSLKGHFGHTLGACGALEIWLSLMMARQKCFIPTANLINIDPRCADLDYIMGESRQFDCQYIMSNNFAFGGINTSLIIKNIC